MVNPIPGVPITDAPPRPIGNEKLKAKRLNPVKLDHGQCEADRIWSYYKAYEKLHPDRRCKHSATFEIGGKRFCARHAGIAALNILCGDDDNGTA